MSAIKKIIYTYEAEDGRSKIYGEYVFYSDGTYKQELKTEYSFWKIEKQYFYYCHPGDEWCPWGEDTRVKVLKGVTQGLRDLEFENEVLKGTQED